MSLVYIESDRLILKPFESKDSGFIIELLNSPAFLKYIGDKGVKTDIQSNQYIDKLNSGLNENPLTLLGVYLKDTLEPIGMNGLVFRSIFDAPDLGYAFAEKAWGKGYASESALAVVDWAKQNQAWDHLWGFCEPSNERSCLLLERCGFDFIKEADYPDYGGMNRLYRLDF